MPVDSVGTTLSKPAYSPAAQDDIESGSGSESNSCIGKGGWVTQCFKWPLRHPYLALGALAVTAGAASYGIYELTHAGAVVVGTVGTLLANRTITANPPPPAKPVTDRSTTAKPVTDRSTTAKPVTDRSTTAKPVTDRSITAKPVTDRSITAKPVTDRSITAKPVTFDICRNPTCVQEWKPVCASDGKTYPSTCILNMLNKCESISLKVESEGSCP